MAAVQVVETNITPAAALLEGVPAVLLEGVLGKDADERVFTMMLSNVRCSVVIRPLLRMKIIFHVERYCEPTQKITAHPPLDPLQQ